MHSWMAICRPSTTSNLWSWKIFNSNNRPSTSSRLRLWQIISHSNTFGCELTERYYTWCTFGRCLSHSRESVRGLGCSSHNVIIRNNWWHFCFWSSCISALSTLADATGNSILAIHLRLPPIIPIVQSQFFAFPKREMFPQSNKYIFHPIFWEAIISTWGPPSE